MNTITGATFPIPKEYMSRFFTKGKTVFIKPATCYKEIKPGMKLVFYQSHEDTGYVGEAIIESIDFSEDPLTLYQKFGDALFLTREELNTYMTGQERWAGVRVTSETKKKRIWMALTLKQITQYPLVRKPERFVPVGGQYIRE
ncbi:MAG: DUF365 domain-containing protein [Methanospirillaceae archaeon]|nr:DUF365 domain-containing protein [Methanospirillaceae archaeon]